jgi:hypothetical protein
MNETPTSSEEVPQSITFKSFLESVGPNATKLITDAWKESRPVGGRDADVLNLPTLMLHCPRCDGERNFRSTTQPHLDPPNTVFNLNPFYMCSDCRGYFKTFSLSLRKHDDGAATVTKYGEIPPIGTPVPNKVLKLFGKDSELFLKGRKCENQGLGVAAFAYYRRVVENHRNDIFDAIIKACETLGPSTASLIEELRTAQKQVSFTSSMDAIRSLIPQGLLINGRNPLLALHSALSVGIHNETDETCLSTAHAIRLVLTGLVERMSMIREENNELHEAVEFLLNSSRQLPEQKEQGAQPLPTGAKNGRRKSVPRVA